MKPSTITRATPYAQLPDALKVAEAARWLDVDVKTIHKAIESGQLPLLRVGQRIVVPKAQALALFSSNVPTGAKEASLAHRPDHEERERVIDELVHNIGQVLRWQFGVSAVKERGH